MTEAYIVLFGLSVIAVIFALIVKKDSIKDQRKDPEYHPTSDHQKIG